MDPVRLFVVAGVVLVVLAGTLWYRRREARRRVPEVGTFPALPDVGQRTGERTWVVFTTPYCASCEPVAEQLRAADPSGRVVKVDATQQADLAAGYAVRTAPTVVMAETGATVGVRLVGGAAVRDFLSTFELDATA